MAGIKVSGAGGESREDLSLSSEFVGVVLDAEDEAYRRSKNAVENFWDIEVLARAKYSGCNVAVARTGGDEIEGMRNESKGDDVRVRRTEPPNRRSSIRVLEMI